MSGLTTVKLLFFLPFPKCTLWEAVTLGSPHYGDECSVSLWNEDRQKLFRILHRFFSSLLHIYSVIDSCIDFWIFTLDFGLYFDTALFCYVSCSSFNGSSFKFAPGTLSHGPTVDFFVVVVLSTFLVFWCYKMPQTPLLYLLLQS